MSKTSTIQPDPGELINVIKQILTDKYEPVKEPRLADEHLSTQEVYYNLQRLFPSKAYSPGDVAVWMHDAGFVFYDFGVMRYEWLLKSKG